MALGSKTTVFLFESAVSTISCGKDREIGGKSPFFSTGQPAISKAYPTKSHKTRQEQRHLRNNLGQGCWGVRVALATELTSMAECGSIATRIVALIVQKRSGIPKPAGVP